MAGALFAGFHRRS